MNYYDKSLFLRLLPFNVRHLLSRYCPVGVRGNFQLIDYGNFTKHFHYDCTERRMCNDALITLTCNILYYHGNLMHSAHIQSFCLSYDKRKVIAAGKHQWYVFNQYGVLEKTIPMRLVATALVAQRNGNIIAASCNTRSIMVFNFDFKLVYDIHCNNPLHLATNSLNQLVVLRIDAITLFTERYVMVAHFLFPCTFRKRKSSLCVDEIGQIFVHDFKNNKTFYFQ